MPRHPSGHRRDPARTLAVMWGLETPGSRGPRPSRSVAEVVDAALATVDDAGVLSALSMRKVAERLGVGTMTLYGYVSCREDLMDLMVDRVYGSGYPGGRVPGSDWRARSHSIARTNLALFGEHPWLLDLDLARPVLGPGETRKYDLELRALEGAGLSDVDRDAVIGLLVGHAENVARRARELSRADRVPDDKWWQDNQDLLDRISRISTYDVAARVSAAVETDSSRPRMRGGLRSAGAGELEFGVDRIVAGIAALGRSRAR